MGCFISPCCCSAPYREKNPWINDCPLVRSSVKEEWKKDDKMWQEIKKSFEKAREWPRTFEGQKFLERQREEEQKRYQELMASRGPEWQREQSEDMRHKQLLCAIYNLGTRI